MDDDDDEYFDESNYRIEDDDRDEEELAVPAAPVREMTAEERLLMREARDAGQRKQKTFYIDDELVSLERSAGNERMADKKKVLSLMKNMGMPRPMPGPGSGKSRHH